MLKEGDLPLLGFSKWEILHDNIFCRKEEDNFVTNQSTQKDKDIKSMISCSKFKQ